MRVRYRCSISLCIDPFKCLFKGIYLDPDKCKDNICIKLVTLQDIFAVDGNAKGFSLFDSEPWSGSKLLFKDATEKLRTLNVENYEDFLGVEYLGSMNGECFEVAVAKG